MILEVDGTEFAGFTSASATVRLDALTNTFSFSLTSNQGDPLPFRGGEACIVKVDGEKIITGHIEIVNVDGDSSDHSISVTGRDNTGDLLDSNLGSLDDIRPVTTLKRIIEIVIKHIGSTISVVEEFEPKPYVTAEDLASPEPGQDVWDFIETLARKRQVLLSSDADGNVLITRSKSEEVDATLQHLIGRNDNNVLKYSVSYDTTGRYNVYRMSTQLNPVALVNAGRFSNETIVSQNGQSTDKEIRAGRQLVLVAENAGSTPIDRAKWEANVRRARGKIYSATVHGFRNQTGNIWAVNELIQVNDEFAGINSRMLVSSVEFNLSSEGRLTTLALVDKSSYLLSIDPEISEDLDVVDRLGIGLTEDVEDVLALLRTPER
jgi:prophage tail gpP-like protein